HADPAEDGPRQDETRRGPPPRVHPGVDRTVERARPRGADAVEEVLVQPGEADPPRGPRDGPLEEADGVERARAVAGDGPVQPQGAVLARASHDASGVDER